MWDKGICRDNGEICQHSLVLLWFDLAHLIPQVLFTKCVQFLDLELKNPKKCAPWAKGLFELTLYLFETELGGSPESKSIPSVFRHITETFFGGYIISGEKWVIPTGTSDFRRVLLHFRGAWLPPSVVEAAGARGPFAQLNEVGWKNIMLP